MTLPTILKHDKEERDQKQGELNAERQHRTEHGNDREDGGKRLRNALGDHLAQGVRIVCVEAHDIAVGVRIKELDGQRLHVLEHLVTNFLLTCPVKQLHGAVVEQCRERADDVNDCHLEQRIQKTAEVRIGFEQERGRCNHQ